MSTGSLSERAMLADLTIRQWAASKTDKKVGREVAQQHGSEESMGRYQKHLVAKEALEAIKRIAGEARAEHYRRTLAWADNGARILSAAGFLDYTSSMRTYETQWHAAVDAFVAGYPAYVRDAQYRLNGLFNADEYPDASQIKGKYALGVNFYPLPAAEDFRVNLGTAQTERIRAEIKAASDAALDATRQEITERIRECVGRMAERLHGYAVTSDGVQNAFRDTLVSNVRDLAAMVPVLNVAGDSRLDQIAQQMERELCQYEPATLRASETARKETAQAADDVLAALAGY